MKKFQDLSPEQKRVAIAKDTLKWLNKGKIRAKRGAVMSFDGIKKGQNLKEVLCKLNTPCEVCQRGGLLYSYVRRVNDFKTPAVSDHWSINKPYLSGVADQRSSINKKLQEVFPKRQLALIERAFEGTYNEQYLSSDEIDLADIFYGIYDSPTERFRAILNNIIKNKGEFKP